MVTTIVHAVGYTPYTLARTLTESRDGSLFLLSCLRRTTYMRYPSFHKRERGRGGHDAQKRTTKTKTKIGYTLKYFDKRGARAP